MFYVDVAKSGKPVPSTLPPEIIPPSCRKPVVGVVSPVEKPASLPRPTAKPPSDATRVPAIQPPSAAAGRRPQVVSPSPVPATLPAQQAPVADPFGMNPLAFEPSVANPNASVVAKETPSPPGVGDQHTPRTPTVDESDKSKTGVGLRVTSPPATGMHVVWNLCCYRNACYAGLVL
jgi:hypothetical protein